MKIWTGILSLALVSIYVLTQIQGFNSGIFMAAALYGVLITLFLLILVWGFTKTQITYLRKIEDTKYQVLEIEGIIPCENSKTPS